MSLHSLMGMDRRRTGGGTKWSKGHPNRYCSPIRTKKVKNLKKLLITLFALLLLSPGLHAADSSAKEFWIDVRTPMEFRRGHIEGALNIPYNLIDRQILNVTQDKEATIHLYCAVGTRARVAQRVLLSLGYKNVINEGGLKQARRRL